MMTRDEILAWVLIFLLTAVAFMSLAGCAGPDPVAPIQRYRVAYGFTPQ